MTLDELRTCFPHTEETIYLNHAATSPLSRPVVEAIDAFVAQRHRTNIENYFDFRPRLEETKQQLARLVGASSDRVTFTPNTSYGLNVLAQGLDWQPGDRIALPACEFPANVYPFIHLKRRGVAVDFIPHTQSTFTLDAVAEALTPDTRLLSLSWVQFLSGFRADLEAVGALCRDRGVLFCVDAIQGLGALQLDVEAAHVDFLACGGQKWLMGTQGIGFLYVTEALQEQIDPTPGWLHGPVDWEHLFTYDLKFHETADRFLQGTLNNIGIAALHAALALYSKAGPIRCEARVLARAAELADGLQALGLQRYGTDDPAHASGIVSVEHPEAEALVAYLRERRIEVAVRNGKVRFSPTYYNTWEEIDAVLAAVEQFVSETVHVS